MAGIDHREHDVRQGRHVFPVLTDSQIGSGRRCESEHVHRKRNPHGLHPIAQEREVGPHRCAAALAGLLGWEDGPVEQLGGFVWKTDVVELDLGEAEEHGLGRNLGCVQPHGIPVGVYPAVPQAVGPIPAVDVTNGPIWSGLCE